MKIIAFAGSNSDTSINKKLVTYAASLFEGSEVEILDLNDYEMPLYKVQREQGSGIPQQAQTLAEKIDDTDLILLSLAENNSNFSAAFKNVFDWLSRVPGRKAFGGKKVFLMATSPGARGGAGVLSVAQTTFLHSGAEVVDTFSLPVFNESFDVENNKISHTEKDAELREKIQKLRAVEL